MAQYDSGQDIIHDNPYVTYYDQPREDPIRIVFVDFTGSINNPEMMMDPTLSYYEFLSGMTELTAPVAYLLPYLACPKFPGQGLTLEDGNWLYRLVKPFNYDFRLGFFTDNEAHENHPKEAGTPSFDDVDTSMDYLNVHRSGIDTDEWSILNSPSGYRRMIDRMGYGYRLEGAWIEIQHQSQKDRDERSWALATGAYQVMNQPLSGSAYHGSPTNMRLSSVQNMHGNTGDTIVLGGPLYDVETEQAQQDSPLFVDGGKSRTAIMSAPNPRPSPLVSPDSGQEVSDESQAGTSFVWQPPKPGELKAPARSRSMPLALPPSPSTMPTTIDPTLLQVRPGKAVPQVNMPKSKAWRTIGGKIMDVEGNEIVFGSLNEPEVEDTATSQTKKAIEHMPKHSRGPEASNSAPTSESDESDSDADTEKTFTPAAHRLVGNAEERPQRGRGRGVGLRGRGDTRGRGRGPGRGSRARGRGRGTRTISPVTDVSNPSNMYW